MYRIGLSTCGRKPVDAVSLRAMKRAGIDVIEICMEADRAVDFRRIRADADAVGIGLWSVHSHMRADFDISSLDRESNRRALRELGWLTDTVSEVGIDKLVIHPTHTPEPFDQTERREKLYRAMECLDTLAEYAHTRGVELALENLPRTCLANTVEEHLYLLSANDKLRVCLDCNHSLIDDTAEMIRRLGNRIITTHVSDRDSINERHWMPGEGVLDWGEILRAFRDVGYRGAWVYELGLDAPPTVERRRLTYADFVTNAKELFAGTPPTVIGTPYRHLGLWGPIK